MFSTNFLNIKSKDELILELKNLRWKPGEKICVSGDNNSGKSLFIKTLGYEYNFFEGEFSYEFPSKKEFPLIIEMEHFLFEDISVKNNIIKPLGKLSHEKNRRLTEFLELCDLDGKADEKVRNISFSEKKMVELIRAVIQYPFVILIDDFDRFFCNKNYDKAMKLIDFSAKAGTLIIVTSQIPLNDFNNFKIENKMVTQ